jgi:hypothetical protein
MDKGSAWQPTHKVSVQFLEDRNNKALIRLPNGSKTSIEYADLEENNENIIPLLEIGLSIAVVVAYMCLCYLI